MATVPIPMPDLGAPTRFSLWLVALGEAVLEGDRVAEVMVPGATFEIPSPANGRLIERFVTANEPLMPGQILGCLQPGEP